MNESMRRREKDENSGWKRDKEEKVNKYLEDINIYDYEYMCMQIHGFLYLKTVTSGRCLAKHLKIPASHIRLPEFNKHFLMQISC